MKRHESLVPISRQHHGGLLTARLLQLDAPPYKGMPATAPAKRDYLLQFYTEHLHPHFVLEEKSVFLLAYTLPAFAAQAKELEAQHRHLEQLIQELPQAPEAALPEQLDLIGKLLEKHIRQEERVFFEALQQELSPEELAKLQQLVQEHL